MQLTQGEKLEFTNAKAASCNALVSELSNEMESVWVFGLVLHVVLFPFHPYPFQTRNRQKKEENTNRKRINELVRLETLLAASLERLI